MNDKFLVFGGLAILGIVLWSRSSQASNQPPTVGSNSGSSLLNGLDNLFQEGSNPGVYPPAAQDTDPSDYLQNNPGMGFTLGQGNTTDTPGGITGSNADDSDDLYSSGLSTVSDTIPSTQAGQTDLDEIDSDVQGAIIGSLFA